MIIDIDNILLAFWLFMIVEGDLFCSRSGKGRLNKMNQAHKAFLQSFMTKGVQNAKEVKELYKNCCKQHAGKSHIPTDSFTR